MAKLRNKIAVYCILLLLFGGVFFIGLRGERLSLTIIRSYNPELVIDITHNSKNTFISVSEGGAGEVKEIIKDYEVWAALARDTAKLLDSDVIRQRAVYDPYIRDGSIWKLNIKMTRKNGNLVFHNPFVDQNYHESETVTAVLRRYIESAELEIGEPHEPTKAR